MPHSRSPSSNSMKLKLSRSIGLIAVTTSSYIDHVNADLPVHCLRNQVQGKWKFFLSEPSESRSTCGHQAPDIDKSQPSLKDFKASKTLDVVFSDPNIATVIDHNPLSTTDSVNSDASFIQGSSELKNKNKSLKLGHKNHHHNHNHNNRVLKTTGKWTMIYDEGFNLRTDSHDFFGFNHFEIPSTSTIHGKKFFRSFCGQTEIGWYKDMSQGEDNPPKYGCFRAERTDRKDTVFYHLSLLAQQQKARASSESQQNQSFLAQNQNQNQYSDGMEEDLTMAQRLELSKRLDHEKIVSKINSKENLGWRAEAYSDEFIAEKMWQLRRKALKNVGRKGKSLREVIQETPSATTSSDSDEDSDSDTDSDSDDSESQSDTKNLPKHFSWADVNGESYLDDILDQADCGSCYAVASIHMLSARYRVLKKDPSILKPDGFSVNFPLYCSDINQGCSGGYPSLISMWSRDVGLVPNKCGGNYFTSSTATCKSSLPTNFNQCITDAKEKKELAKVKQWNYIGGYYGACTAQKMLTDLFTYGPIAVALEPGPDFMYYRSGVYKSISLAVNVNWVKVDHAVLLIGYGEEDGKKFWTIQNSWGDSWGENGKIRIIRGENESGVEFQAVSATVEELRDTKQITNYLENVGQV